MPHLKNLLLCAAIAGSVSFCENTAFAETTTNVNNFDTLYNIIKNSTESNISFDNDITDSSKTLVFKKKNGVIDGNGYSIISNGSQHLAFDVGGGSDYGNLTLQNLSIENFINTKNGWGGAVYNEGDLNLKNIKLKNNTVNSDSVVGGGAITNNLTGVANISGDIEFTGNSSVSIQNYGGGGAVYNAAKMEIHADGYSPAVFKSNSSVRRGGAFFNIGDLNLSGNFNFEENTSTQQGGAIANLPDGKAILDGDFNFTNNNVSGQYYGGGAVYNEAVLEINSETETNFISNSSGGLGGAVYNSYGGTLSLKGNFNFTGNKTNSGGGAIANDHESNMSLSGNFVFANNDSDVMYKSGGAIYNSANMTISTSDDEKMVFKGNIAGSSGGAIYNIGTLSLFGNFEFVQNENSVGNTAYNGGAIYNAGMMNIEGSYLFDGNTANHNGGAIANYVGSLTIKGSKYGRSDDNTIIFRNNVTNASGEGRGGAIYIYGRENDIAYLNIVNADFYNNTSNSHGGAIYVDNHVNFNVFGSRFIGNRTGSASTKGWGGAIGLASEYDNVYGYIENSLFKENYSYDSGGAIPAGTVLTIVNSQFFGNQAGMSAGAVSYNPRGKWTADSKKAFKLIADGKDTVFAGNWVGNGVTRTIANSEGLYFGNAIVGEDGESVVGEDGNDSNIFFNAGNAGKIIFNDIVNALGDAPDDVNDKNKSKYDPDYKYFRADKNNPNIQLNKSGVEYFAFEDDGVEVKKTLAPTQGTIVFNNTIKGANLVLHNGVLAFGQDNSYDFGTETPTEYFSNGAKITLKGGTLDLANGKIESGSIFSPTEINVLGDAKLQLDIDVLNGKIDYINSEIKDSGANREGLLTIDKVNFLGDFSRTLNVGEKSRLQFVNANLLSDDRTVLEESLKTIITSNAGYALELTSTFHGLDSIEITKTVSAGGLPVAISLGQDPELETSRTYVYNATTNEEITESGGSNAWDKPYFVSIDPTNVRHASNVLRGKELVINGNGKNIFTSNNVIGIELGREINTGEIQTLVVNDVKEDNDIGGWSGFNSALINNGGNVVINNSIFKNNNSSLIAGKKSGNGGAIINLNGNLTITNSDFTDNTATDLGGAIYNSTQGVVNIIANNQDSVIFDGNSILNGTSNAIHNEGTLNLTSDKNSSILFYDKISGDTARSGVININSTNLGRVVFNETVSNQNLVLNSGILQLGSSASDGRDDYFENVNLTLNGGKFNVSNGFIDTIKIDNLTLGGGELILDAKIGSEIGLSDYILANTVSGDGKLFIGPLNILDGMAEGQTESHFAFTNDTEINSSIEDVNRYITINRKRYAIDVNHNIIHIIEEGKSGGFAYDVIDTSRPDRSFSLGDEDEIVTKWIGGDNHLAGMWFRILGGSKGKSLIAQNDIDGIVLGLYDSNPQQLDITDVTSYQGFSSAIINKGAKVNIKSTKFELNNAKVSGSNDGNGGVIKNIKGTVNIADGATFERNTAQTNGGAIFNAVDGVINFQTETDKDINFVDNVANGLGNDIFNEGTINLNGNGKINITGGIAGVSGGIISNNGSVLNLGGQNENYVGNFVQGSGTTNVTGSFFGGKSEIAGVLNWLTDVDIVDGATLTFNGGNLNVGNGVNSAKLTIKGNSSLDGASNVEIKNNSELTFAKDAEIGTISGAGTLGIENSVLTFNDLSEISDTLKFYSKDGTANIVGTSDLKTSSLLNQISNGSNINLKISLDNVNISSEFFVDGAEISSILTKNDVNLNSKISGSGLFVNDGNLTVNADLSGFTGLFKQVSGDTTISSSENIFGGSKILENGKMTVSSGFVGYNDVSLSSGTTFKQIITDDTVSTVDSDTIKFLGSGASAKFESNGVVGNILLGKIDATDSNTVSFVGNKISLKDNNYQGNTVYEFVNSEIDLIEKTTSNQINDYVFDNLKSENSMLSFNVHINRNDAGNTISTDTLTINSSELQKFDINNIYITGEENGQRGDYFTVEDVLKGNAEFNPNQTPNIMGATTSWTYKISLYGLQTIKMSIENYANENTLKTMNNLSGSRFFHFSEGDSNVYYIGSSLGETANGTFSVKGYNNVISGKIIDSLGSFTGENGSFFDVSNQTNLTVSNLTLQDAQKIGNGSVANITNENAEVSFVNSIISKNSSTEKGGAVYNENGIVNLENTSFVNNNAEVGGAIYNATNSVINVMATNTNSVIFENNTANGVANDVYNEGTLNLSASINSSIVFNGGITGDNVNKGKINIGELNFGNVIFNNTTANQDITVNNGVLKLGASATQGRNDYFENVDLSLNGGTLNVQNDFLDTIKVGNFVVGNSNSEFVIDADISSKFGSSDNIVADSVINNGSLYIGPLNIINAMADGQNSSEFTFINKAVNSTIEEVNKHITVDGVTYNVSVDSNKIIIKRDGVSDGFAYAVIDEANAERTYEIGAEDEIVTEWIGGNNNLFGKRFQLLGGSKGKSLIAQNDIDGIVLGLYDSNPQQLDITGVTSYQGFSSAIINKGAKVNIKSTKFELNNAKVSGSNDGNGGVIKNIKGTVNIADGTTFEKNTAQTNGGAIFNAVDGVINFQTETDKDINFVDNVANGLGNDIFNEGTINLNGNGKINITGGIAGVSGGIISNNGSVLNLGGQNENYVGNFVQGSGTTNVTGSFFGGKSEIAGVLNWLTDVDIVDGATLTFNGGNLNVGNGVNSAKLTIKGNSSLDGASNVEIKNNSELTFAKDAEIGTISGAGTLGIENSVLTMNENSYLSETLKFKSQNSSAILSGTDFSKSDLLLGVIASGENDHLDLTFDNVKTSKDLTLSSDGIYKVSTKGTTSISGNLSILNSATFENLSSGELTIDGKVSNEGTLNNSGTLNLNGEFENAQTLQNDGVVNANSKLSLVGQIVNDSGDFNINGELVGNGSFTNNGGNVNLSADSSQFNGSFVQNSGVTNVSLSDLIFGGEKVINSGELKINGGAINYDKVKLGSDVKLSHSIDTTVLGKLDSNTIEFIGSGAKASFVSDNGNLTLGNIDNGQSNTISIVGNTISLSDTEFLGGTVYEIKNSELNLIEENPYASVKDYIFDNLKTENSKLSFNVKIDRNDDGNTISTDTLTVNNLGQQKIDLANIYITGEENGQRGDYETTKDVLNGDISFNQNSDPTITGSTTSWIYKVTLNGDKTIKMAIEDYADNNTLYEMNDTSNKRFFQFSENDDRVYHIEKSLDETKKGTFNVNGFDKEKHILSGLIDETTGKRGDFFKVTDSENETVLNIKNITIKDAYSDENGSVLFVNSDKSSVSIANSTISNNESNKRGGAIYNESGNLLIENTDFSGNKSEFEGGAIYNNGTTKIVLSNFENNTANVVGGAIFNSGSLTLISNTIKSGSNDFYQTAGGSTIFGSTKIGDEIIANNIESNISGEGTLTNTGILNLSGDNSDFLGNFEQTSGQTTISGTNALFFAGTNSISGGILNWYLEDSDDLFGIDLSVKNNSALIIGKDENQKSTLEVSSGVIEKSAAVLINKNSLFAITGSEVTLDENDAWNGSVLVADGGVLNLENLRGNGKILGDAKGTINLISGNLTLNDPENTADDDKSTILETAKVSISNGSNLIISNGKVTLNGKQTDDSFDDSDTWSGTVTLVNNGNLTISEEFDSNGALNAESGNLLLVNNAKLSLNSGSVIADSVKTEITPDSELVIKGGKVTIGNDDIWRGTINLGADGKGGTLNYNTNQSGTLVATSGSLNLLDGSVLNIKIPSQIKNAVIVDIQKGSTVNVNDGAKFNLDSLDKWNGKIAVNGGKLSTEKVNNSNNGGVLQQIGGETVFDKNSNLYISGESFINGGKTSILGGSSLHLGNNVTIRADKLTMDGNSMLNVMNGSIDTNNIINMQIDGKNNVMVDLNPNQKVGDTFKISNLSGNGTLNIADFNFVGSTPIDKNIKFQIFDAENISDVEFTSTDKKILTPIGNYILVSQGGGAYMATLSDFNPQTFRGQVATLSAYNHQLLIDDMLTNHFILPNQNLIDKAATANKYSSTSPLFSPYQTSINDGGLWTKSYVSFETLSMTHGLNVDDVVYGTLIGADLPAINLGQGWKFTPTGYVAYNGGNEKFNGVKITQNGGQGGVMGTVSKKNFIGSMAVYGGGYSNDMSVSGNSDSVGNWFVGTAIKTAYNIHASKKFIVQPTAAFAYNLFGSQNWKSDFGSISMNSGTLNGINLAPGVNLILSQKTWSLYGTAQYMFNINEDIDAKAGNISVDSVGMRHGYVNYGIGVTKTWKEQLNSYLQVSMRNGGRTGVGFQFGLNYSFNSNNKNKIHSSNSVRKTSNNYKSRTKSIRAINS